MNTNTHRHTHRRERLRALINDRFGGVAARLADAVDLAPSYVSRLLHPEDHPLRKNLGERMVEKIETALGLPGYFSDAPLTVAPLRGGGTISVRPGGLVAMMEITAPDEVELLRHYRRCAPALRPAALAAVRALAKQSATP